MKRFKSILGILLIIISIVGLFFWEWKGRDLVFMEQVLVANGEIAKGTKITSSMFVVKNVPDDNLIPGAITPDSFQSLEGKVAAQFIAGNDQIISKYFISNQFYLKDGEAIFVIKPSWIAMRSSSLRRGDIVDIYDSVEGVILGTFQIAYVKDEAEREVRNADIEMQKAADNYDVLDREDSTSVIDHIEIITTYNEFTQLAAHVNCVTPSAFIIVQRGEKVDT